MKKELKKLLFKMFLISIVGIALALWESVVVIYLRMIPAVVDSYVLPLIPHFPAELMGIEQLREAATLVVFVLVPILAGKTNWERFAIFLWLFAIWDIFYYIFLYLFIGWPSSIFEWDVVFLLPVEWWFPVYGALLVMFGFLGASVFILKKKVLN